MIFYDFIRMIIGSLSLSTEVFPTAVVPKTLLQHDPKQIKPMMTHTKYFAKTFKTSVSKTSTNNAKNVVTMKNSHRKSGGSLIEMLVQKSPLQPSVLQKNNINAKHLSSNTIKSKTLRTLLQEPIQESKLRIDSFNYYKLTQIAKHKQYISRMRDWSIDVGKKMEKKKAAAIKGERNTSQIDKARSNTKTKKPADFC